MAERLVRLVPDGAAIRRNRRLQGFSTQAAFARRVRTTTRIVSNAENGRASEKMMLRFAEVLGVCVEQLYRAVPLGPLDLTAQEEAVLDIMRTNAANALAICSFAMGRSSREAGEPEGEASPTSETADGDDGKEEQ